MVTPLSTAFSNEPPRSFKFDVCRLDEWPPFLDLGLVECAKCFRGPQLGRRSFGSEFRDLTLHRRIVERFGHGGTELVDDRLRRTLWCPKPIPKCDVEPQHAKFIGRGNVRCRRYPDLGQDRVGLELAAANLRQ